VPDDGSRKSFFPSSGAGSKSIMKAGHRNTSHEFQLHVNLKTFDRELEFFAKGVYERASVYL